MRLTVVSAIWMVCAVLFIKTDVAFWFFLGAAVANSIGAEIVNTIRERK